ncbi:MAG TPA: hypothetical protein VF546_16650 [Pyrinomonadaceae bacterium]
MSRYGDANLAAGGTRFPNIQQILDDAVEGQNIGAHGPFWRGITRDEFVAKLVFGCQIIFSENGTFVGPKSPLVQILQNPIECPVNRERPQMPVGFPTVPAEKVQIISDWIDAQCPA